MHTARFRGTVLAVGFALLAACGDSTGADDSSVDMPLLSDAPVPDTVGSDGPPPDVGGDSQLPDVGTDSQLPDAGVDGPVPDGPVPDIGVDAPVPDVGVDAPLPDIGVDAPLPDVGIDSAIPDVGADAPVNDGPNTVTITGNVIAIGPCSNVNVTIRDKNDPTNSTTSGTNGTYSITFSPNVETVIEAVGSSAGTGCMGALRPYLLPPGVYNGLPMIMLTEAWIDANVANPSGNDYDPGDGVVFFEFIKVNPNSGNETAVLTGLGNTSPYAWAGPATGYQVQPSSTLVAGQPNDLRGNSLLYIDATAPSSGTYAVGPSGAETCSTALNPVTMVPTEPLSMTHMLVFCTGP